jgi:hypothetical protein
MELDAIVYDRATCKKSESLVDSERTQLSEYWVSWWLYKLFHETISLGRKFQGTNMSAFIDE